MEENKSRSSLLILGLLIAFPSLGFVLKHAGYGGLVGYVALVLIVLAASLLLFRRYAFWIEKQFRPLALLTILGMVVVFPLLHPFEDDRGSGKSSDRNEGLEMAVTRMFHGKTPYYPINDTAGPLSLMPGSILLAAPFVPLGNSGYQNIFWLSIFIFGSVLFFKNRVLALYLLVVPSLLSFAFTYEFVSGGDLIANAIFVTVGFLLVFKTIDQSPSKDWKWVLACMFLGVCLASRANFLMLLPIFSTTIWNVCGFKKAFLASFVTFSTFLIVVIPFYLIDPEKFTPLRSSNKIGADDLSYPIESVVIIASTGVVALLCALLALRQKSWNYEITFFRLATLVTILPILGMICTSSVSQKTVDLTILGDRFGIMYLFFALLGWGSQMFYSVRNQRINFDL